jgi:hypothetical protein
MLSDSNGPHGLASSLQQYCTVSQEARARETTLPTALGGEVSLVESGARARRAHGAEGHSSMVIERPMSRRNVTDVDNGKSQYRGRSRKVWYVEDILEGFGSGRTRTRR